MRIALLVIALGVLLEVFFFSAPTTAQQADEHCYRGYCAKVVDITTTKGRDCVLVVGTQGTALSCNWFNHL